MVSAKYLLHTLLYECWQLCIPENKRALKKTTNAAWQYVLDQVQIDSSCPHRLAAVNRHIKFIATHSMALYTELWWINSTTPRWTSMTHGDACMREWQEHTASVTFPQWITAYTGPGSAHALINAAVPHTQQAACTEPQAANPCTLLTSSTSLTEGTTAETHSVTCGCLSAGNKNRGCS
jgi:hypothetical protein